MKPNTALPVPANDQAADPLAALARGWPGAALVVDAAGIVVAASSLSTVLPGMRAPFGLPSAAIASQIVDSAGRMWRVSAPVDGRRLATCDSREEPDAAHRFTAAVSHEIRTPLNGILGMAALLEETELTPSQRDYAGAIRKSGARLLDLLNNVLDYSRMEAGDIPLDASPFDTYDLVQDVAELLAPRAHAAGLDIAGIVHPDLPQRMIGDAGRLRQILFNLAGNAIKFTETGAVLIEARPLESGRGLALIVRDTGAGIPEHAKAHLFDAFSQVSAADARRDGGVGLGLAIVARLVEAMKGKVHLHSAYGRGAMFVVELPIEVASGLVPHTPSKAALRVALALPPASTLACISALGREGARLVQDWKSADIIVLDAALPSDQVEAIARTKRTLVVLRPSDRGRIEQFRQMGCAGYLIRPLRAASLVERVGLSLQGATAAVPVPTPAPRPARKPGEAGSVLIADDNAVNALLARSALTAAGFRVDTAGTGAEALERMAENDYSVVFMDIRMPVMDGLEATRRIRSLDGPASQTPIVALTADIDPDLEAHAREAGISQLAAKPIDPARLREIAERWASKQDKAVE
jgi:signal transduction histidine kinase/CheY-like chemotaxis protein